MKKVMVEAFECLIGTTRSSVRWQCQVGIDYETGRVSSREERDAAIREAARVASVNGGETRTDALARIVGILILEREE
ncbi:MAG: hypothetical protein OXE05_00620 [Chloroflexi bacterium]|nr:hypothetical protein [Chloroflexota bacterium]